MGTNWLDSYVKCPYYRNANSENRITCQGVADSSQLEWKFTDKKNSKADLSIQLKTFCCDRYQNCEVYQMLRQIYGEE